MELMLYSSVIIGTILVLATILWIYLKRWNDKEYRRRNVKPVDIPSPFWSLLRRKHFHLIENDAVKTFGTVFGVDLFFSKTIFVAEPDLLSIVFHKEFSNFTNRRKFNFDDPIFKRILFMAEGELWKRLRSVVTPTFATGKIRRMKTVIDSTVIKLWTNIEAYSKENAIINVRKLVSAFTLDTIIQIGFGIKVDSLADDNNQLVVNVKKSFSKNMPKIEILKSMMIFLFPKLSNRLGIGLNREVVNFLTKIALEIIVKKREELKQKVSGKATNLIEIMLEAELEDEIGLENKDKRLKYITNLEIIAQICLFLSVGFDTSATVISTAFHLLATNPKEQNKLYEDILKVLDELCKETLERDPFELVTYDTVNRFEYLDAVVNETLRLYPPATAVERRAANDITLSGVDGRVTINVKKNDIIRVPIYAIHHSERYFDEPEKFQPERFLGQTRHPKMAFLPFGTGPRSCVAKGLGLLEVKLALLHIIRCYRLSVCSKTIDPMEFYIQTDLLLSKDNYIKIEKRMK